MITLLCVAGILFALELWMFSRACFVEPRRFVVEEEHLQSLRVSDAADGLRIVQISDLHFADNDWRGKLEKLVKAVNQAKPDILVFTGDLFDDFENYHGDAGVISAGLSRMNAKAAKLAVWGNHDRSRASQPIFEKTMENGGFKVLSAESLRFPAFSLTVSGYQDGIYVQNPKEFIPNVSDGDFHLVLCHEPDLSALIDPDSYDLMLSGHTHGGQVNLPILGLVYVPVMGQRHLQGWFAPSGDSHRARLYVNRGIGGAMLGIRYRCQPEISLIVLENNR